MNARATLVLANHRPETIPAAQRLMARHDAVILEEPRDPQFLSMLDGQMSIETYLETQELEYPEFSRRMANILRERHRAGTRLYQIEPFIDHLLAIHERFADGEGPSDLPVGTALHRVYLAEREATAALIDFYAVSTSGTFEATVEAVKRFALSDARRFALRDRMRAAAMVDVITAPGRTYIEAGLIHFPLWHALRRRLPSDFPLRVHFLMADAVRSMGYRSHLYGPGDLLTLHYRFHPQRRFQEEGLLAARALIYSKLIAKEEMIDAGEPYPHTRDELEVGAVTARLTLTDCRRLYPPIRRASTTTAREMVRHYLGRKK
ncbi:MAG: hypothetical protein KFF68_12430 [Desulfosarcina sp.]|nr:hypothetical protein [Desulfosarcina sp.]